MNFLEKAHLRHELQSLLRASHLQAFKNDRDVPQLLLSRESTFSGAIEEQVKKRRVDLKDGQSLDFLLYQNVNQDTSTLLHTQNHMVEKLLRCGQGNAQATTSKAIKMAGKYQVKVFSRAVKSRIISNLDAEKQFILELAQDRIKALQELERMLGHRIQHPQDYIARLGAVFARYEASQLAQGTFEARIKEYRAKGRPLEDEFVALVRDTFQKERYYEAELAAAAAIKDKFIDQDAAWLESSGYYLLHEEFIKRRITTILTQAVYLNQILTHRYAFLQGDLEAYLEAAALVTNNAGLDYHNPVTEEHQLCYTNREQAATIDSDDHCDGREELEEFLLCVSVLCGDNSELSDITIKGPVQESSATKWLHFKSFFDNSNPYLPGFFSSWTHGLGLLWNLLLGPFNLIETIVRGNEAVLMTTLGYEPAEKLEVAKKSNYYALAYWVRESTALSTRVGLLVHRIFSNIFWEGFVFGLYDGIRRLIRLPFELYYDFQGQSVSADLLLSELIQEFQEIQVVEGEALNEMGLAAIPLRHSNDVHYVRPEVALKPYSSQGLLNSIANGFRGVMNMVGLNLLLSPLAAVMGVAGAGASYMAFYTPNLALHYFGKDLTWFLKAEGYLWSQEFTTAALSSMSTNFELMACFVEAIEHGSDSVAAAGIAKVVNDPALMITLTTLSWMIGYAILYEIEIPGISAELRAEVSVTTPELAEILGGGKMVFAGQHMIAEPQEKKLALVKDYVQRAVSLCRALNGFTQEKERQLTVALEELLTSTKMDELREEVNKRITAEERTRMALILKVTQNKERLKYLSPLLKAKLQHHLQALCGGSKGDAYAVSSWLNPEDYEQHSTLRSLLGRLLNYVPVLVRCALSPLAFFVTQDSQSASRPWQALGDLVLDDTTSTVTALVNFTTKPLEWIFNLWPRIICDLVFNSVFARAATKLGYDEVSLMNCRISSSYARAQEVLAANSSEWLLQNLARQNTAPHPESGLINGLETQMEDVILPKMVEASLFAVDKNPADLTGGGRVLSGMAKT